METPRLPRQHIYVLDVLFLVGIFIREVSFDHSNMAEVQIHGDKRAMIYTVAGVFMGLEILAVLLRFFARRMGRVHWKDDDWFIYLGLFWTMTLNILIMSKSQNVILRIIRSRAVDLQVCSVCQVWRGWASPSLCGAN